MFTKFDITAIKAELTVDGYADAIQRAKDAQDTLRQARKTGDSHIIARALINNANADAYMRDYGKRLQEQEDAKAQLQARYGAEFMKRIVRFMRSDPTSIMWKSL